MRLALLTTICVAGFAATAAAQQAPAAAKPKPATAAASTGMKLSDLAGTWRTESSVKTAAGGDTVVTSELTAGADGKWTLVIAGRDPVPVKILASGGDSVVAHAGPFPSAARPGQTVTTHEILHFKGDDVWGTIEAHYGNGDVVKGTVKGSRKK